MAGFDPPAWLADRVFYQVFPDRFAERRPVERRRRTAPGRTAARRPAGATGTTLPAGGPGALVEFFGGDLAGLEGRLDHLADLGVNAIYLNPIFETRSNHGYDTIDYDRVAAHFGGDDGARVAAPSDRRARHPADARHRAEPHRRRAPLVPRGAGRSRGAETGRYFVFRERPDDYASWLGVRSLPKLDYRDTGLRDAMYAGPAAVLRRWLRPPFSVDGWRIDVANMLGRLGPDQLGAEVARGMREAVKEENPEAYLLGEHSFDATDQLAGDQWDGVMNYAGFQAPVLGWLRGIELRRPRQSARSCGPTGRRRPTWSRRWPPSGPAMPWAVARCQYNLLDSHDTARIRTSVGGDRGRVRAAFGLLLTYVGVPSILYGDEVGLEGHDGLTTRRTMPWDRAAWDLDELAFVRTLVRHRIAVAARCRSAASRSSRRPRTASPSSATPTTSRSSSSSPADRTTRPAGAVAVAGRRGRRTGRSFGEVLSGAEATVRDGPPRRPVDGARGRDLER